MAQGYPHIGKTAADVYVTDRGKAIRGLLETLQDEDSIKNLRPNDAEMHIKRLDDVSHDLNSLAPFDILDYLSRPSKRTTSKPPRTRLVLPH